MLYILYVSPQNYNEMFLIEFEEVLPKKSLGQEANSIKKGNFGMGSLHYINSIAFSISYYNFRLNLTNYSYCIVRTSS